MGVFLLVVGFILGAYFIIRVLPDHHPLQRLVAAAFAKRFDVLLEFVFRLGLHFVTGKRKPFPATPDYQGTADAQPVEQAPKDTALRPLWDRSATYQGRPEIIDVEAEAVEVDCRQRLH